ncbi:MAG TPA: hypothetical protein VNZ57_11505 [Longimicrobiales bacterium]|nr:hypothetical protein [Longimicrobiales bacterium]
MRRRYGFGYRRRSRRVVLVVAGVAVLGLALFMRWRASPAVLELVALDASGEYEADVHVPASAADSMIVTPGAVTRVPLVLAVRNVGGKAFRPNRLELNVPIRYRLTWTNGEALAGRVTPGNPLVRYEFMVQLPPVAPSEQAVPLPFDTIWIEPIVPTYHCIALSDSVPDFVPATGVGSEALSRLQIFYSFFGEDEDERQAGRVSVEIDPALLEYEAPAPPPVYPAQIRRPSVPMPPLGHLTYVGHRYSFCGPPEEPLELLITTWATASGGWMFVVDYGGVPRKYMFDLDDDGVVEQEMWDSDGDGQFEGRRAARLRIPAFLLPPLPPEPYDATWLAELPDDSLAKLDRFAWNGRYEQRFEPEDTAPRTSWLRPRIERRGPRSPRDSVEHVTEWGPAHPLAGAMDAPGVIRSSPSVRRAPSAPGMSPSQQPATTGDAPRTDTGNGRPQQPRRAPPPLLGREGEPLPEREPEPATEPDRPAPSQAAPPAAREPEPPPAQPQTEPEPTPVRPPPPEVELLGVPVDSIG